MYTYELTKLISNYYIETRWSIRMLKTNETKKPKPKCWGQNRNDDDVVSLLLNYIDAGGPIRSEAQNGIRSEGQKRLQRPPVGGGDAQHSASPGEAEQQFEQHRGFGRR
jgi:hypothetical protein